MPRLPENLPAIELGVTVVAQKRTGVALVRIWALNSRDERTVLQRREWPGGRPSPGALEDLMAALSAELGALVVTTMGVQGVVVT